MKFLKGKSGYYYKQTDTGKKIRISKEEYMSKGTKMKGGNGSTINDNDIKYQDKDVCILHPEIKKGIVIFTHYNQPKDKESLCKLGLKSGKQLHDEGVNFGRSVYHPYIFFRAPFFSRPIDHISIESEIKSSYDNIFEPNYVYIRVDPDR